MKKLALIILGLLLITSCRSRKATTKKEVAITKRVVKNKKTTKNKPFIRPVKRHKEEPKITTKTEQVIPATQQEKVVINNTIVDDLYRRKPNLHLKKIDYIRNFSALAIREMEKYKIPASITLAQGLLESKYGDSYLTKTSNNHFGIKCHKWTGAKVYHDDDAKGECFRKYNHAEESYRDHSLFLVGKNRYKKLFTYASYDYQSWAKGLRKAGYATDKRYPQKLISLIEEYELYRFDKFVLGDSFKKMEKFNNQTISNSSSKNIRKTNPKKHIVQTGETLYSISGLYYIEVAKIKEYNNLSSSELHVGQLLKLYPKKNKKTLNTKVSKTYIVKSGDTIYSIARKNKININLLKQRNNLLNNTISIGQELIIE